MGIISSRISKIERKKTERRRNGSQQAVKRVKLFFGAGVHGHFLEVRL